MKFWSVDFRKSIQLGLGALICAVALAGCQTTKVKTEQVKIEDVLIKVPHEFMRRDFGVVKRVSTMSQGSRDRHTITFARGFVSYDRYFRGGILKREKRHVRKFFDTFVPDAIEVSELRREQLSIGNFLYLVGRNDKKACLAGLSNHGVDKDLIGGLGSEGSVRVLSCWDPEDGDQAEERMHWFRQFKIAKP